MKFKRQRRFEAEVQTASLNDIMFFLLLFFLIVSTLGSPNVIKLMLPKSDKSTHDVSKQPVSLSITENKEYFLDKKQIDFTELEGALVQATSGMDEPTVVLRAAQSLTIQDLVDVMAIGARIKIRMVLATELTK
ncbi:MAG: biopolymer transporter ExbD [Cytophagaceae bacterium]|nr:biopolymer transporter ExbD [Cytophagaceae bacterium]MBK9510734.1 biopolymer transporter ExbD [Cytophagaceae bacterium]MBK9933001.1 biopolymer transporter ExbD [Cytophagaceae bacterium]MBL0303283.1 biopolymer transporter ExbD [Cytophagaceae bacterium]MBL0326132.1 biopolymer transporter ExbD [Cytophagaceae bacterium]